MPRNDGPKLREDRQAAEMTLDDVLVAVRTRLPRTLWMSKAKIARDEFKPELDPYVVSFLAGLYGADLEARYPEAKEEMRTLRDLLIDASGWFSQDRLAHAA